MLMIVMCIGHPSVRVHHKVVWELAIRVKGEVETHSCWDCNRGLTTQAHQLWERQ